MNPNLYLTHSIDPQYLVNPQLVENFDSSGFEVTALEELYLYDNDEDIGLHAFGHKTISAPWDIILGMYCPPSIKINHAFLSKRMAFQDDALDQLTVFKKVNPNLLKLIHLIPKFGADVSLEVLDVENDQYYELLHLEKDFYDFYSFNEWKNKVEQMFLNEVWLNKLHTVSTLNHYIAHLPADDQSDTKASLFGFTRTYDTLKIIR